MPYMITSGNCVCKQNPDRSAGEKKHCYGEGEANHQKALAYMRALYAAEKGQSMSKETLMNTPPQNRFMALFNDVFSLGKAKHPDEETPEEEKGETPAEEAREDAMAAGHMMAPDGKKPKATEKDTDKDDVEEPDDDEDDVEASKKELGGHLVTDDKGNKHLPTTVNGKTDWGHVGAAWAALHGGYRGNKYEGPDKEAAIAKLRKMYEAHGMTPPGEGEPQKTASKEFSTQFSVYKQADDTYRWIGVTSSGFRDRDNQLVTSDALRADVERMNKEASFGNLSFWHVMFKEENPATLDPGIALDIATCDASEMVSVSNVESGVFFDNSVGKAFCDKQAGMGFSREFFYPASEPDAQGNFNKIRTFRRTILPAGRASNLMSAETLSIAKESQEGKLAAFKEIVGEAKANEIVSAILRKEKELESAGVEKKEAGVMHAHGDTKHAHVNGGEPHLHEGMKSYAQMEDEKEPPEKKGEKPDAEDKREASKKELVTLIDSRIAVAFKEFTDAFVKGQSEQMQSAKKERDTLLSVVKELGAKVEELYGDAPHSLTKGWKPSEAAETLLHAGENDPKVKAAKKAADPREELLKQPMGAMVNFMIAGSEGEQQLFGRNGN